MMIEWGPMVMVLVVAAVGGFVFGVVYGSWPAQPEAGNREIVSAFWRGHEAGILKGRTERLPARDDHGRFIKVRKGRK